MNRRPLALLLAAACAAPQKPATRAELDVHRRAIVADAHCDVTQDIVYGGYDFGQRHADHHEDLPRDREGGLDAQIFSIWVDPLQFPTDRWFAEAEHQILDLTAKLPKAGVAIARTAAQVRENKAKNVMSALFGVEGGHELWPGTPEEQLAHLRRFAELGARYMTLTWSNSNDVGGSSGDEGRVVGLTGFGRQVIAEMERLGILVDLSHVSDPLFWDAIRAAKNPVIASHSSARQRANVPRNLTDAQLEAVGKNGGAVCVNFFVGFLDDKAYAELQALQNQIDPQKKMPALDVQAELKKRWQNHVPMSMVADHIQHIAKVAGIDHVCLGSDYDGIPFAPVGLDDASMLPNLTAELLRRGMSEADVRKVLGENLLRVLDETTPRP
ncbi:MAG: dipeptidase [Myxococcales bacterium]|nr:dipeptidase [Myxococcales bacterium]